MSAKAKAGFTTLRFARSIGLFLIAALPLSLAIFAMGQTGEQPSDADVIDRDDTAACMACHVEAMDPIKAVDEKSLAGSPHKEMKCQDCHSTITSAPHTEEMKADKPQCIGCHTDQDNLFQASTHAKADKVPGDHPTCVTCHGGGDPHSVKPIVSMTKPIKAELCSACHRETDRMKRYGVDTEAVTSYEESYHGKALQIFHAKGTAVCSDCHHAHSVLNPSDPRASTHRNNGNALCSQAECHAGANVNFAMSGANHLRLKIRDDKILAGVNLFFQALVAGVVLFLMGGIALDLRIKVFGHHGSKAGRLVGVAISLAFLLAAGSLGLSLMGRYDLATTGSALALGSVAFAYLAYLVRGPRTPVVDNGERYPRLSVAQRWQHGLLAICFTALLMTGLPLHFPKVPWLQALYGSIGGINVARPIHRIAAIGLILVWTWHVVDLLIKWKKTGFSRHAVTMVPNVKDLHDFVGASKYYLGMSRTEPKYDKYQFRQKLDYLAEYWGVPVMVLSGFLLWFPIYWGNRLPEQALSIAIVAHGWEATLAFLAIILWHLYNEHFNPDTFPANKAWYTGTMTRAEMEREHPLELERILQQRSPQGQPEPEEPTEIQDEPEAAEPAGNPPEEPDVDPKPSEEAP